MDSPYIRAVCPDVFLCVPTRWPGPRVTGPVRPPASSVTIPVVEPQVGFLYLGMWATRAICGSGSSHMYGTQRWGSSTAGPSNRVPVRCSNRCARVSQVLALCGAGDQPQPRGLRQDRDGGRVCAGCLPRAGAPCALGCAILGVRLHASLCNAWPWLHGAPVSRRCRPMLRRCRPPPTCLHRIPWHHRGTALWGWVRHLDTPPACLLGPRARAQLLFRRCPAISGPALRPCGALLWRAVLLRDHLPAHPPSPSTTTSCLS